MLEIKIVMTLHNIFSQYFKICSSKVTSTILRLYCIVSFIFAIHYAVLYSSYLIKSDPKGNSYNTLITAEYFVWVFTAQISGQAYLSTYARTILSCDSFMGYTKKVLEIKYVFFLILFCVFLSLISLLGDSFMSCYWASWFSKDKYNLLLLLSQWFMMQSSELANFRVFIVVGLLQNRLMLIRTALEENTIPLEIVGKEEIRSKLRVVRKCVRNYRNLLDAFDSVVGHMNFILFIILLFAVPELIMFGYSITKQIIFKEFFKRIIFVDGIRCLVKITAPCIICELCHNEVDRLKMLLTKQIIQGPNGVLRAELQRALDYISRRPFSFTLLCAARVDVQLPVGICALVFTYVIISIEFTHFVL